MKKTKHIITLIILLTGMPVILQAAENDLSARMASLAHKTSREAFFTEERHASYLSSALKTQGRLRAIPPDRLEKIIVAPEPITQVITGNNIIQSHNGVTLKEISLDEVPALSVAINTLRAVVFGNMKYLQKTFTYEYKTHAQDWSLLLVPLNKQIKKQVKSIKVIGSNDNISEFLVTDANGDFSKTRLYEHEKK